ncbi:carbohydrate diacid regulator [Aequitasia blattaphilus]|uniref:Helix-turn-helix domain-containing protein n=1 Tax=Aequitasia blattaphilus TaxID=2949332 RepID=A0ABT1E9Y2_9FIRM|nr:helix-turn-helix domain-containing protein [Aequitasia blattaphilus]MCP1102627.1 helix-turn-helix domain-containing protein [Aequitasia blattaphilus]MCR8615267.1 helix-turn-helix domain-containing protein [Aequitasia blattaphilus]
MISNQILQNTIEGLKSITRIDILILDLDGKSVVSTNATHESYEEQIRPFVNSPADSQEIKGKQFFKIFDDHQLEYVLVVSGSSEDIYMIGKIAAFQIQNLLVAYKERFDKDNFIKNLLLDNLLLVDIYNRAKKLRIDTEVRRVIFIIETKKEKEGNTLDIIRRIVGSPTKDFVTAVDEKSTIVVKELEAKDGIEELNRIAQSYYDFLKDEGEDQILIAYGTIVDDIREVSKSYKEAKLALDVGKIFFDEKNIVAYSTLGIGRLIYQLPIPLCKMFIREIFEGKSPDDFDEETLTTINKFFENNLNVSETSRQLYIHRNTLVYRLDKLQKGTGLDLRVFEDAITFKIALMVVKYMKYMESLEY